MRLLLDMNLTPRWVDWLSTEDGTAVHWADVGALDATDVQIMPYASDHDMVVVTADLNFGDLLAATQDKKPSVVIIRAPDTRPEAVGAMLVGAIQQVEAELQAGALVIVNATRARIRILPLV